MAGVTHTRFSSRTWDGVKYQIEYIGTTTSITSADTDPRWTIRRIFRTTNIDGSYSISEIRTLYDVVWADRASLPW